MLTGKHRHEFFITAETVCRCVRIFPDTLPRSGRLNFFDAPPRFVFVHATLDQDRVSQTKMNDII